MAERKRVVVLCTGNSARSQMLEAILRDRLAGRLDVASAGTAPAPAVHPLAIVALAEIDVAAPDARPKHVSELRGPFDVAVTVCDRARESCPVLPGAPVRVHVGYPDPAAATGTEEERMEAFRRVRDSMLAWTTLLAALAD